MNPQTMPIPYTELRFRYWKDVAGLAELHSEPATLGDYRIDAVEVRREDVEFSNFGHTMRGNGFMRMEAGRVVRLYAKSEFWMSDTRMERETNMEAMNYLSGHALIGGLGLGLIPFNILSFPDVLSLTVVEREPLIAAHVGAKLREIPGGEKLNVVVGDVFTFEPERKYDSAYFDIWPTICDDNLDEFTRLKRRYRRHLSTREAYMGFWCEERLRAQRRRDRRQNHWWR